ncbi:MAG: hypothetical protein ACREF3_10940 [Acetobacteraceae bacterium]
MTISAPLTAATSDILFGPDPEWVATTNAWAFMHWLHSTRGVALSGWFALQQFASTHPLDFQAALIAYARLPSSPSRLTRHSGVAEALVFRRANTARISYSRDDLRNPDPSLPTVVTAPLTRLWPAAALVRPFADVVLHGDVRPDDRVLVAGTSSWPWLVSLLEGATIILAAPAAAELLVIAEQERASVLIAPATTIGETAFRRPGRRPNLAALRIIIATGGPLSPEGRRRVCTWIRPDLMLLARSGDTTWGNPLEPVLARPAATPALFTRSPTRPAP